MAFLDEFSKVTIGKFMGLYQRGLEDNCPVDHSPNCQNVKFNKRGEISTRDGSTISIGTGHPVTRIFLATFNDSDNVLLTCDGVGNIYQNGSLLLTIAGMTDFVGLNLFNKCFIIPILSGFTSDNPIYLWDGTHAPRPAAGLPPPAGGALAVSGPAAGHVDIGLHYFAVCFVTDSGFTTPPGPAGVTLAGPLNAGPAKVMDPTTFTPVIFNAPGGTIVHLSGIPIGPPGTVGRIIIGSKSSFASTSTNTPTAGEGGIPSVIFSQITGLPEFFYLPGGFINDNVTTTLDLNFYDTDLSISADSLFDLLAVIPGAVGLGGGAQKYHGRAFFWGGEGDLIRVSNPGDIESIDNVAGFIQIPSERDGNIVRGTCINQDILYFTKAVGILSVTDNGGVPSSWPIIYVDGGVGSFFFGLGTITASQEALNQNQTILLSDIGGLYTFNGIVQQPSLSWKIDDIWKSITALNAVTVAIDPFAKMIYILAPLSAAYTLLVGDYNEGLDWENIKWTTYTFPFVPTAIAMANFNDGSDFTYVLRLGSGNNLFKIEPGLIDDSGAAINSFYDSAFINFGVGSLNIFRHLRARIRGNGVGLIKVFQEDRLVSTVPPSWTLLPTPGKDYDRQINQVNEKLAVRVGTNGVTDNFTLQRLDIYGKSYELMRPQ